MKVAETPSIRISTPTVEYQYGQILFLADKKKYFVVLYLGCIDSSTFTFLSECKKLTITPFQLVDCLDIGISVFRWSFTFTFRFIEDDP